MIGIPQFSLLLRVSVVLLCVLASGCAKENAPADPPKAAATAAPSSTTIDPNKPRIIAFGDSLTSGFGLADPNKSYPSLLRASLLRDGFDYDVLNLGIPGDTSAGGLKRLWLALKYANVKVFILELGANDIIKKTPATEIEPNLAEIIRQAKATGAQIILCGYVVPQGYGYQYVAEIREMYAALAKENDLPLITNFMQDVSGNAERMQDDGIHPNEKGAAVIEQNVRAVVVSLIARDDEKRKQ